MKYLPIIKKIWKNIKGSERFHNFLVFLIFVVFATIFWFMMAMNDSVQGDFKVKIQIDNVPDTVIFITEAPASMHVPVRDKGTNLLRLGVIRQPTMHLNFNDYSANGLFRFTPADMKAALKGVFGGSASVLSCSLDSIQIPYSTGKGKSVAVDVDGVFEAAPGSILIGKPQVKPSRVKLYGPAEIVDTVRRIYTEKVKRRNIGESIAFGVSLRKIKGIRIIPDKVEVFVNAEPLVRKEMIVSIQTINVPEGLNLVLFPSKVEVEYYVPMSKFSEENPLMEATVDYSQVGTSRNGKLGVELTSSEKGIVRPSLKTDSVEYSVVR